ncbi:glycosyltransferase family 2 protein [Mangrovimicrobium sediminis]|uniref:glycosyltransferase family 2 protein n=1 Tax=Mangrovimicrobium sediminis TaxID=2562682 RepID=UPI001436CBB0|nr:glycosyltransferase family 2 protein [Haliea sp. SAOS-164]
MLKHLAMFAFAAARRVRDLECVQDNTAAIAPGDVLLFSTLRNEQLRIPYFLEHYRALGVDHFCFVDNGSSDGFREYVSGMPDVSVWYTEASYKEAASGMHWLNGLLHRYAHGHWCVVCDPDELLVYPHYTSRSLDELGAMLAGRRRSSMFTLMLDLYSDYIDSGEYRSGDVPWEVCPWFDAHGYRGTDKSYWHNLHVKGGVRARQFYGSGDGEPPALNKLSFVRWKPHYYFVSSMHNLAPRRPNKVYEDDDITGCVLHFKFISAIVDKVREEMHRKQHYNNSAEYRKYASAVSSRERLYDADVSQRYSGWEQLVELRLMNPGPWWK